jgi:cytochrome c biogenesis protein ResB
MINALKVFYRGLASYAFAIVILFFLLVLTLLGTLEQIDHGLFAAQEKYFNSVFLIQDVFGVPLLPLPGVYLLLILLSINICMGAIVRFRLGWSHLGVFIVHIGILFMLLGGFITFKWSEDGHLTLYEGEQNDVFESYHEWEVAITEVKGEGPATEMVIPGSQFAHASGDATATFARADLPFELELSGYLHNSAVVPASAPVAAGHEVAGGMALVPMDRELQNERNVAGIYATATEKGANTTHEGVLWGMAQSPFRVTTAAGVWDVTLRHRTWPLPFNVILDDFTRELHPGTSRPASFSSDVTVIDPEATQKIHISMNKPLRYKGYTLFQASWGPQNAGPNDPLFSSFAVVRNPADQWPLYGCIIITAGLLIHFCYRLILYLRRETRTAS